MQRSAIVGSAVAFKRNLLLFVPLLLLLCSVWSSVRGLESLILKSSKLFLDTDFQSMVYHPDYPDRQWLLGRNGERVLGLFSVEARRHSSKSDHVMWKEESGGRESARARLKQTWLPPTFIARRRHFHILENHESIQYMGYLKQKFVKLID